MTKDVFCKIIDTKQSELKKMLVLKELTSAKIREKSRFHDAIPSIPFYTDSVERLYQCRRE